MNLFLSGFIFSLPQLAWEKRLCCCCCCCCCVVVFWKFSFARIGIQLMVSMRCIEPRILYTLLFYSLCALVWCNMLSFNKTSMRSLTLILTSYLVLSPVLYQNLYFLVLVLLLDRILHELKITHCFYQVQL